MGEMTRGLAALKGILFSYGTTGVLLMILAFLLYWLQLDRKIVGIGIMAIYLISTFVGGFYIGKKEGNKRFLWGFCMGILYFAILGALSLAVKAGAMEGTGGFVPTLILCGVGGMLGGMLS